MRDCSRNAKTRTQDKATLWWPLIYITIGYRATLYANGPPGCDFRTAAPSHCLQHQCTALRNTGLGRSELGRRGRDGMRCVAMLRTTHIHYTNTTSSFAGQKRAPWPRTRPRAAEQAAAQRYLMRTSIKYMNLIFSSCKYMHSHDCSRLRHGYT